MNVLVLNISKGKAVVMADNGDFLTIPANNGMKEGAAFEYIPQKKTWTRYAVAAAASLLLCVLGFGALGTFTVSSYIDVNINPGVRLAVNQWGKVISAEAINEDGAVLLNEISSSFLQDPETSVKQIVGQAWKDGTLQASGHILLTISDNDMQRAQSTEMKLMVSALETVKEAGLSIDITLQKLDRQSFDAMREAQEAMDDKSKSGVYNPSRWYSEKGGLYIEEAEYAGNGVIEVEFSRAVSFTGDVIINVEDFSGIRYPVRVIESNGETLQLQCDGLKEHNIYKVTVGNAGTEGYTLTSFLYINNLAMENESQYDTDYTEPGENGTENPDYNENGGTDINRNEDNESEDNEDEDKGDEDNGGQHGYVGEGDSGGDKHTPDDNEDANDNTDNGNADNSDDEGDAE